jgi:hypothetical protein
MMLTIVDRRAEARGTVETMNHRHIYSGGRENPRRDTSRINGIILHHTNFNSRRISRFDSIIANYVVMQDGTVLFVRDLGSALNSVGTDHHAIDIEFVGIYPHADGAVPPAGQIRAGRKLVKKLVRDHGLRYIYAHAHFTRKPCCGPHLWFNVGEWAVRKLALSTAGARRVIRPDWSDPALDFRTEPAELHHEGVHAL